MTTLKIGSTSPSNPYDHPFYFAFWGLKINWEKHIEKEGKKEKWMIR